MNFAIKIPSFSVKFFLKLSSFFNDNHFLVLCKDYDEDSENYTGLYWDEDKGLESSWYEDYQIWIRFRLPTSKSL
jgi:hypothetical protein